MSVLVILIRHTTTPLSRRRIVQGSLDPQLDEGGEAEAAALSASLRRWASSDTIVLCSPQRRAVETATRLAEEFSLARPVPVEELRELRFGTWEGRPEASLLGDPVWGRAYREMLPDFDWGQGETLRNRVTRAEEALDRAVAVTPTSCFLVVSHGFLLQGLISALLTGDPGHAARYYLTAGAFVGLSCHVEQSGRPPSWTLQDLSAGALDR